MQLLLLGVIMTVNISGWQESYASGDWHHAYDQAEEAVETDSTSSDAWAALAFSAVALGYSDEASAFAQSAVELDSLSAMSWAALGRTLTDSTEISLDCFQTALEYDSTFILGLIGKAHCLMLQKNYPEALIELDRAMYIDSSWISIRLKISEIYRFQQEYENALACVTAALEDWPEKYQ